jgi:xanthine dehydrogenase small subunit
MIRFLLDGETVTLAEPNPNGTLLELLRTRLGRTGTKEGCAEGDCGACTVLLGEPDAEGGVAWRAVNSCILFEPMVAGKALLTVESLSPKRALADGHGSQCGFCTPGFVMSLYGRTIGALGTEAALPDVLAGNLCRCTGYGPILEAGEAAASEHRDDSALAARLRDLAGDPCSGAHADPLSGKTLRWHAPRTADELAAILLDQPDARLVAGATDVGLWVTKQQRVLEQLVFIGDVADLRTIEEDADGVTLGACVRYSEALGALAGLAPDLGELVRRIGGLQVRNAGTIGGNIANGSPIGDMPPALIALGATIVLRRGGERRTLPTEHFFLRYGEQDRRPGEFVESVHIPRPKPDDAVRIVKLSKRFDSDISALCGAFALGIEDGVVRRVRIAFGGMAGIPARARACEAALLGRPFDAAAVEAAAAALAEDFTPLDDLRGSAGYRLLAAGNLLRRILAEQSGELVGVLAPELADG